MTDDSHATGSRAARCLSMILVRSIPHINAQCEKKAGHTGPHLGRGCSWTDPTTPFVGLEVSDDGSSEDDIYD